MCSCLHSLMNGKLSIVAFSGSLAWLIGFLFTPSLVSAPLNLPAGIQKATAHFEPTTAKRGELVTWKLVIDVTPGWHTYPITQENPKASTFVSRFDFRPVTTDLVKVGALKEPTPKAAEEPELKSEGIQVFTGQVVWQQQFVVHPQAVPGGKSFKIKFNSQVCTTKCIPIRWELETPLTITDAPPVMVDQKFQEEVAKALAPTGVQGPVSIPTETSQPLSGSPKKDLERNRTEYTSPEEYKASLDKIQTELRQATASNSGQAGSARSDLWAFLLAGVFWGGISLITPCVFPMIPITVSFFLKQADKEHHRPVTMALVYCGTIVVVLTIAAVVLLSVFRLLSVHPVMNFVMGALFIFFALSLFGMFEIELSSPLTLGFFLSVIAFVLFYFIFKFVASPWSYLGGVGLTVIYLGTLLGIIQKGSINLAQITSSREGKGGLGGTMFMALTFTIISFACVAPFLGGFGGTAATSQFTFLERVLGGLAFSATFAAPFFVLALFPTLLKNLPRSGSWLNIVKVVMGFLELAAALKFFRAAELVLKPKPVFFTYDLVLAMYVILCLLSGLYLLGIYRLPHDTPEEHIGVPRLMFGFFFLSLAVYFLPALFKQGENGESQRPSGTIYAWIDSFLLPDSDEDRMWSGNLAGAIAEARTQQKGDGKKLVFVDFTGETCTNCKINENTVFRYPEIRDLLQSYQLVKLYTDKVPNHFFSSNLRSQFGSNTDRQQDDAQSNLLFQKAAFGTEQLPLYVILEPKADGTISIRGIYDEGKINDETAFTEFLKSPVKAVEGVAQARNP